MIDWTQLSRFIGRRDPGFVERTKGASTDQLSRLASALGVRLPEAYAGYLAQFGLDDGGLEVSQERYMGIERLLEELEAPNVTGLQPTYPSERFMWIGGQIDESDGTYWGDLYLDLFGVDREDPPVLAHDFIEPYDPDITPYKLAPSLSHFVQQAAYHSYESVCFLHHRTLKLGFAAQNMDAGWTQVLAGLSRSGFEALVPGEATIWMGARGEGTSVCATQVESLVIVRIAASEEILAATVCEMLQDNVPAEYQHQG